MFKLNEKYKNNTNTSKCDYFRCSLSDKSTKNTANSQIFINIPRDDSVVSLLISYLDLYSDVLQAASNDRYAENSDIRLLNLGLIALLKFIR